MYKLTLDASARIMPLMNVSTLTRIGLTQYQAGMYLELLSSSGLTPPELAQKTGESRTSAYMALAKLEELGLALRDEDSKKLTYTAANPTVLEELLDQQERELEASREAYKQAVPDLLTRYYQHRNQPGVRFYQGEDTLKKVYQDHISTGEDIYFIRTEADEQFFGQELYDYMRQRAECGITSYGLAPGREETLRYAEKNDSELKRIMEWFPPEAYTAPVEISAYGTKVAIISFGDEVVATIIESPQIAQAFREVFEMAKTGAKTLSQS